MPRILTTLFFLHINPKLESSSFILQIKEKYQFTSSLQNATGLMVIGGDGTLLHALRKYQNINIPIYAINHGYKGILMLLPKQIIDISSLQFIKVKRLNSNYGYFLNEIVYGNNIGFLNTFEIYINNKLFKIVKCDNIIVASNSGSTGYSLSANGPYVFDGIVVSCIATQSLFKNMVLPIDYEVKIVGKKEYVAVVDGVDRYLGGEVVVNYSGNELQFASQYDEFGTKLDQFNECMNGLHSSVLGNRRSGFDIVVF